MSSVDKDKLAHRCFGQFYEILNLFNEGEQSAKDFGTGDLLYRSEIHILEALGHHSGCSISELARSLGITRGAVQKLSIKLEKRGYLERFMSCEDGKRIYLRLSEKGKIAEKGHKDFHKKMNEEIFSLLKLFNGDELDKVITVFDAIEKNLKTYTS